MKQTGAVDAERSPQYIEEGARGKVRMAFFLILLGVALVAPIWLVEYPPLLDYPNHLASAFVLKHLDDPNFRFEAFYGAEWRLYPNLASEIVLVEVQRVLPAVLAGRLLLSLSLLALPLGAWFFVRTANRGESELAIWSVLVAYNHFFLVGYLNYQLSLALCFVVLGIWLRYVEKPTRLTWWALLCTVTALYFSHLGGFSVAGFVVLSYGLLARLRLSVLMKSCAAFVPAVAFLATISTPGSGGGSLSFPPVIEKIKNLATPVVGYSLAVDLITCLILALVIVAAGVKNKQFRPQFRWLGVCTLLLGVYFLLPAALASSETDIRLLPFLYVLALAVVRAGQRGRLLVPIALLLFGIRIANVTYHFCREAPRLCGWAQGFSAVPRDVRVLPIVEGPEGPGTSKPYAHFWAYGIIKRGWLCPYLFSRKDIHVVRTRAHLYAPMGFGFSYQESMNWAKVRQDYQYVWAYNVPQFAAELSAIGVPIYRYEKLIIYRLNSPLGSQ